jgi:SAM-dependent methyltransferase
MQQIFGEKSRHQVKKKGSNDFRKGFVMNVFLSIDYLRYFLQLLSGFRSRGERQVTRRIEREVTAYLDESPPWKILDLANGRLRPQYTLLRAAGHDMYGIDLINRPAASWEDWAYKMARRLFVWRAGVNGRYSKAGRLVCGDVSLLSFPAQAFDLVISMPAVEHFLDVPAVVDEVHRVLRPGGIAWIGIHPFTSPTGGHNVSFTQFPLRRLPQGVDAWDHLRRKKLPFCVPLNKWRIEQYVDVFVDQFEILDQYCASKDGENLLTPQIVEELSRYSAEELTCANYVIIVRKSS